MSAKEAVNTFDGGLNMDLNPITTPNNVMTSSLNATMITYDGNEFVLQNDMGNGRVETAKLDSGYIPVGIKEYGGIIYVASVNPLTNKCQLGSFPSPERNFTTDELSKSPIVLQTSDFFTTQLNTMYVRKELLDGEENKLRPGDKFILGSTGINDSLNNILSDYKTDGKRILRLHLAILDDDNNISYIEDEIHSVDGYWIYPLTGNSVDDAEILGGTNPNYPYNVYKNKVSGKLILIAELETPKTFNTSVDVYKVEDDKVNMSVPISWDEDEEEKAKLSGVKVECTHEGEGSLTRYVDLQNGNNEFKIEDLIKDDKLFTYTFTPYTSFGTIDYLAKRGSMNLSYIGTGKIDLAEWRYYVEEGNSITISWGLEAYPRYGFQISEVKMTFVDVTEPSIENIYTVRQRKSYNGNFTEYIVFDEPNIYFESEDMKLSKGKLYVVKVETISTNTSDSNNKISNITYRLLYTSSNFNSYYIANRQDDFSDLKVNCELDIEVNKTSSGQSSNSKNLITNLVKDAPTTNPLDMMSYVYTSFSEGQSIKATPILKKPSDNNFYIGDIAESDIGISINVESDGISVTDYEPRLSGSDGVETYYDSIKPNIGSGTIKDASEITLADLNSDDSMKFEATGNVVNNTWTGTFKGSNVRKITSDVKVIRESGSVRRIAPYIDLSKVSPAEINTLFGHDASTPIVSAPNFHFNKMIYMMSGRRGGSKYMSGIASYTQAAGWSMNTVNIGEKENYWGDLFDSNTLFTNHFYSCLNDGYSGRPIFTVLRGAGREGDGDGRLVITSNANISGWPYWNTDERQVNWATPDGGGYDLNCNRWSFILWKTTDSDKYAAINACGFSNTRDMHSTSDSSLMDKLMIMLSQLYVVQNKEYNYERYIPNNIYYQNAFKTAYKYKISAAPSSIGTTELNIISDNKRITPTLINSIIAGFGDVASDKVVISNLPSHNNLIYVVTSGESIVQNFTTSVSTAQADSLLTYYVNAGQSSTPTLAAESPNGTLYERTINNEEFSESKIYWMQRGNVEGFHSIQDSPFTLYKDTFTVNSSGNVVVNRTDEVELSSSNYAAFGNLLALETSSTGKPNILLNKSALSVSGTTKRNSRDNSDNWFNIYNIKVSNKFSICR